MIEEKKAYLQLHIAVLLFGFTAILGELIQLPAITLVWWRVLITSVSLLFFIQFGRKLKALPRKTILQYMGIGVIVALHWITFYGAIKLSNASMTLICMATISFFTSLIEPIVMKRKISGLELTLGLMILPGMYIIFNNIDPDMIDGFIVGIFSAMLAATFATLNKVMVNKTDAYTITFLELGSAFLFISILLLIGIGDIELSRFMPPTVLDWFYIIILALLCTTLAYVLSLNALKHLTAFASNLVFNFEPLYGIILAAILLKEYEQLNSEFYLGGMLIVMTVFSYPFLKRKFK